MILFSQSSDRTGERVWHLVTPLLIGGLGLMLAGVAIGTSAPLAIAAFSVAAFGISGSLPVFWNLPTAFLGATAAAGGIAFINSVGNISGYAAPQFVGLLHDFSGSYRLPMLVLGAIVIIAGFLVPVATSLRPAQAPVPSGRDPMHVPPRVRAGRFGGTGCRASDRLSHPRCWTTGVQQC